MASGSGAKQSIDVDVSLAWNLSEPGAWQSISTSTRHWGEPLPAVPEPSQGVMVLFGAVVVGAAVRSRRRASRAACTGGLWPLFPTAFETGKKKAPSIAAKCLIFLVGGAGFEPATPAV